MEFIDKKKEKEFSTADVFKKDTNGTVEEKLL